MSFRSSRKARSAAALLRLAALLFPLAARAQAPTAPNGALTVASPDGRNVVAVAVRDGGLFYEVSRAGRAVLLPSRLGVAFRGAPALRDSLRLLGQARAERDTTWALPWGEVARVREHYRELRVDVGETSAPRRRFALVVRAFDDGVAFRYELPDAGDVAIDDELTEFTLADDGRAWWTPANKPQPDRYEELYLSSPVSKIDTANTPLTIELQSGVKAVIHEADLVDYAGMSLAGRFESRTLRVALAPWADGVKVRKSGAFSTPWRTIQLADRVEDLAPQTLTLKLNPPPRIDAAPYRPMKYDGIWWGMHLNTFTWSEGPKHGATTANTRRYIDFAAANGLGGVLVEGWNLGWNGDWMAERGSKFSFTQPYPDYDLAGLAAYARQKGVTLIAHNETAMGIANYESQLDSAFALYERLGIRAIKSGYVNDRTAEGHAHTGQYMVRHFRRVVETAARHGIAVVAHEPIKDTGERRTWPNFMSREAVRGMEYNAWGGEGGNPPEHETILFFTRTLAGPVDYTPGIFDLRIARPTGTPRRPEEARPRTTLAKQLALYVVLYSPVQMAADLIENYEGQPAFRFIRDVAVDWDTTRVLAGRIGDYVAVARKAKGRDEWFVGAITDEEARTLDVALDFLPAGRRYVAEIYADGPGADWRDAPERIAISSRPVTRATRLSLVLARGGGQAIRIRPAP